MTISIIPYNSIQYARLNLVYYPLGVLQVLTRFLVTLSVSESTVSRAGHSLTLSVIS